MNSELVHYEMHGPAAVLTMNRPERRNALNRALIEALSASFGRARDDSAVRCVVLTGAGPVFCAGLDLGELQEALQVKAESPVWENALVLARLYDLIYTLPKPTIAAVNGPALAGGAGLVTVCDLAVATLEARFGYPEVRRGLVAAMVMPHLLRHVGERMARYLLLTGEMIDAETAEEAGLITQAVPAGHLRDQALVWRARSPRGGRTPWLRPRNCCTSFRGRPCPSNRRHRPAPNRV